ncbi:Glycerophosphoryl diester phosphodiesterase [Roseivivax lentus]|uniref:Glycerophosphoryl diester phosphodiesterase n=1 Tax=Roseivivax lentus TaxID=633194 RepID=A0A1N7K8L8_9RHOB|nr:glycerophosphodiester phosphodiesterase family protein [Roseivivax lentus]SIS57946.1 Glycerophosphoryl diester phosphodiesterase [Roseivivax lentus]
MQATLPPGFLARPIAHRGLHDVAEGRPENSIAACEAAIEKGYGIEIDLQLSADGQAMVFHDYDLDRLTGAQGKVRDRDAEALSALRLIGSEEGIPTLTDLLKVVSGRVPVLIEFKDQDGAMGPDIGALEAAAAGVLANYRGEIALMSFNPHSVRRLAELMPNLPRGLVTSAFEADDWPDLPEETRAHLAGMPDLEATGAAFISHDRRALHLPRVGEVAAAGLPILCWTVRNPEQEAAARQIAHNITFEGYDA